MKIDINQLQFIIIMSKKEAKEKFQNNNQSSILTKNETNELKSVFEDFLASNQGQSKSQSWGRDSTKEANQHQSQLIKTFLRIKNTFYDLNSRAFMKYAQYSSHLQIRKQLQTRPQLLKLNLTVNALQCLSVGMCIFLPRKWVNKTLLSMASITVYFYFLQKLMLNYYIEQIAVVNNRMQPIQQQARNLIQYKYRIQNLNPLEVRSQQNEPYIQWLLEEVDRKNLQYLRFKKVAMLV